MKLQIGIKRLKEAHFIANKDGFFDIKLVYFHKGDVFTISTAQLAYCLMTNQINTDCFKVVHVYNKRLIPKQWYRKLMFWRWIKMVDLVDVEFTGNN